MTPHRTNARGTFVLDRYCGPLGRIRVASGTTDPREWRTLNDLITRLKRERRWDLLGLLARHQVTPLALADALAHGAVHQLPTAEDVRGLAGTVTWWIEQLDVAAATKHHHESNFRRLLADHPKARLSDLPELLVAARTAAMNSGKRSSFRDLRVSSLALLRDVVGRDHRLYVAVRQVERLKVTRRVGNPQTPDQLRVLALRMPKEAAMLWALALTGMRRGEYWGRWDVLPDRILIHGTKSAAAERAVPRVYPVTQPTSGYDIFVQRLRKVSGSTITPHDLRKPYMTWMEDAGIPRTRRKIYLGHEVADVSDVYERRDITQHLVEDADRLRAFIGEPPELRLAVSK